VPSLSKLTGESPKLGEEKRKVDVTCDVAGLSLFPLSSFQDLSCV
jgi:hypothetical protein